MKRVPENGILGTYRGNVYPKRRFWVHVGMAGADGFEPPVSRVRVCCLTTWRSPYKMVRTKRFELLRTMPGDSESPVSSYSTTFANWQELMESNHRLQIWSLLFSSLN